MEQSDFVRARWDYIDPDSGYLTLYRGDIIHIAERRHGGWLFGAHLTSPEKPPGLFPMNFTTSVNIVTPDLHQAKYLSGQTSHEPQQQHLRHTHKPAHVTTAKGDVLYWTTAGLSLINDLLDKDCTQHTTTTDSFFRFLVAISMFEENIADVSSLYENNGVGRYPFPPLLSNEAIGTIFDPTRRFLIPQQFLRPHPSTDPVLSVSTFPRSLQQHLENHDKNDNSLEMYEYIAKGIRITLYEKWDIDLDNPLTQRVRSRDIVRCFEWYSRSWAQQSRGEEEGPETKDQSPSSLAYSPSVATLGGARDQVLARPSVETPGRDTSQADRGREGSISPVVKEDRDGEGEEKGATVGEPERPPSSPSSPSSSPSTADIVRGVANTIFKGVIFGLLPEEEGG